MVKDLIARAVQTKYIHFDMDARRRSINGCAERREKLNAVF
jgi:hypothetical protein